MVIGKISSLATTIFVLAIGFIFLKQAYGTSIGTAGIDVGQGLSSTAGGISSVISAFINPITSIFGTISGFFGSLGNGNAEGGRNEPSIAGRDERKTPTNRVKTGDTTTITYAGGVQKTLPIALSPEAKQYYKNIGVTVTES